MNLTTRLYAALRLILGQSADRVNCRPDTAVALAMGEMGREMGRYGQTWFYIPFRVERDSAGRRLVVPLGPLCYDHRTATALVIQARREGHEEVGCAGGVEALDLDDIDQRATYELRLQQVAAERKSLVEGAR